MRQTGGGDRDQDHSALILASVAALAGFLLGRNRRPAPAPGSAPADPLPKPEDRGWFKQLLHDLREPLREKDKEKRREEEAREKTAKDAPPPPEKRGCLKRLCCGESGETPAAEKAEEKEEDPKGLTGIVVKTLAAVGAGIGVVGAVTVVGAGVFWVRFDAIGLPATQAVSVIPKAELLVQGAQEMTIFLLVGLAVALVVALCDPKGIITRGTVAALVLFVAVTAFYVATKHLELGLALGMISLAILLALACVAIAFNTDQRQMPLLVSVFVASLIFSASCALLIVHDQRHAQAIAVRFGVEEIPTADGKGTKREEKGLKGIYVAVTDDTIYFARLDEDPQSEGADETGLYEVPRVATTTYAIGPLLKTEDPHDEEKVVTVAESGEELLESLHRDGRNFLEPKEEESESAAGATGATGPTGPMGATGPTGPTGPAAG